MLDQEPEAEHTEVNCTQTHRVQTVAEKCRDAALKVNNNNPKFDGSSMLVTAEIIVMLCFCFTQPMNRNRIDTIILKYDPNASKCFFMQRHTHKNNS